MKLNETVGRNQIPSDSIAFDRLNKVFTGTLPPILNTQRRSRVDIGDNKTRLNNDDLNHIT